jgi:hypothetical protein
MPTDVTLARYKRRLGQELTDDERKAVREYDARYAGGKVSVHAYPDAKARWNEAAKAKGCTLSAWIVQQLEDGLNPSDVPLRQSQAENQTLRDEIAMLRRQNAQLATENANLQTRKAGRARRILLHQAPQRRLSRARRRPDTLVVKAGTHKSKRSQRSARGP